MKNPKTTSVLVGLGLVLVVAYGYAQGRPVVNNTLTNTFINNTGQAVGGLHIQYYMSFGVFLSQNPPGTFGVIQQDGSGGVDLTSGTVAAGGSVQISIVDPTRSRPMIKHWPRVDSWWWTDGSGILAGQIHKGCTSPDCTIP